MPKLKKSYALPLVLSDKEYSVFQIADTNLETLSALLLESDFFSLIKTEKELSIITESSNIKDFLKVEEGWRMLYFNQNISFDVSGLLSAFLRHFADLHVPILVSSTFNTDYIFYKKEHHSNVLTELTRLGYVIEL